ncbi:polysaccharide pyruvyl transferase family protein [Paracoccus sp. PAR01]|uniref:polysaccharide pyruvyl transferase family protein n=1 Tax=Paracoccus sp. PAR01 TaxID=2769282 RepID=UPI00177CFACD|nr:polysaccharide pyruvyl transferase family protein [Paracoccus sp. PAR01]MBD9528658.1 polysaccharide pyruvyl transferase family protein [Paracoccus sp. PAR01]
MKVGLLWENKNPGLYSNAEFKTLYRQVGHNNGNLAFVHAVKHQIEADIIHYSWNVKAERVNDEVDFLVIPCANQLGKHTNLAASAAILSKVTKPIVAIGLGAQSKTFDSDVELTEGTRAWLDVLIENGQRHGIQNVYTRGPYTSDQIRKLTGAETLANGCPTHFINPRADLGRRIQAHWERNTLPQRIAVAGGHEAWTNVREIEQQLIAMMMDPQFPGIYIVQSMANMIKTSRGLFDEIEPEDLSRLHRHIVPHYSLDQFKSWALNYARSYYDIAAWMDDLRRHDLLIGPRFHGAQLAIQAERMACTVTIDSRTEEMCRETGVPYLRASDLKEPLTRTNLRNLIKFDGAQYDQHRSMKCARYTDFLRSAGLKPAAYLDDIASDSRTGAALEMAEAI